LFWVDWLNAGDPLAGFAGIFMREFIPVGNWVIPGDISAAA
jgi:hypothetical protein